MQILNQVRAHACAHAPKNNHFVPVIVTETLKTDLCKTGRCTNQTTLSS